MRKEKFLFLITNPVFLVLTLNSFALLAYIFTPEHIMENFAETLKYYSTSGFLMYICFILFFVLGYILTPKTAKKYIYKIVFPLKEINIIRRSVIYYFTIFMVFLTILGYFLWFKNFILNPSLFFLISKGTFASREILKESMIPGLTTLTELGIIAIELLILNIMITNSRRRKLWILVILVFILSLSILRVIFFGERLALLELIIPAIFVYLRFNPNKTPLLVNTLIFLFLIIWSSELTRSYLSPTYYYKYDPIEYLILRLLMYFATTVNNAFLLFDKYEPFLDFLPTSLSFIYESLNVKLESNHIYKSLLETYLNPEYNNKSSWGDIFFDWGILGLLISFILGSVSRFFYVEYRKFSLWGLLIYPIWLMFLLQSYRILYINTVRFYFPIFIILMLYAIYVFKKHKIRI